MKGIVVKAPGDASQLVLAELPVPRPGPSEVLLQVKAAGVNRPDVLQRLGLYPPPPGTSPHLGLEVAGIVVGTGEGVDPSLIGRSFMALCNGGGYAQYVCVPAGQCMPIPEGLSYAQAATLPEVYLTVWQNLVWKGRLSANQVVLVHGGSSGIGTAAIQVARRLQAQVLVTVGHQDKAEFCRALGATAVFNHRDQDWSALALEWTSGRGVNIVLDMVAGSYLERDLACLAVGGQVIVIALLGGRQASLDAGKLLMKQATLTGSTLRPQSAEFKARLAAELGAELYSGFAAGHYRAVVSAEFELADAASAHRLMESGELMGKIVLTV